MAGGEAAILARRREEGQDFRLDNRDRRRSDGVPKMTGRVVSVPSAGPPCVCDVRRVFLPPVTAAGEPVVPTEDDTGTFPVVFLNRKPVAGDLFKARQVDGLWINSARRVSVTGSTLVVAPRLCVPSLGVGPGITVDMTSPSGETTTVVSRFLNPGVWESTRVENAEVGTWRASASAPGYATRAKTVDVPAATVRVVELLLWSDPYGLTVRVLAGGGCPVVGATVTATGGVNGSAVTDSTGMAFLPAAEPVTNQVGTTQLHVDPPAGWGAAPADVTYEPPGPFNFGGDQCNPIAQVGLMPAAGSPVYPASGVGRYYPLTVDFSDNYGSCTCAQTNGGGLMGTSRLYYGRYSYTGETVSGNLCAIGPGPIDVDVFIDLGGTCDTGLVRVDLYSGFVVHGVPFGNPYTFSYRKGTRPAGDCQVSPYQYVQMGNGGEAFDPTGGLINISSSYSNITPFTFGNLVPDTSSPFTITGTITP